MLNNKRRIISDALWSILAMSVMHGTLQLFVYPSLNRSLGAEQFGNVLFILAILNIAAPSCGMAANNVRLLHSQKERTENGEYLLPLLLQYGVVLIPSLFLLRSSLSSAVELVSFTVLCLFTTLRFYGDAEYRMKLDYRGSVLYYAAVSLGYILGLLLSRSGERWMICFTAGELLSFLYLFIRGDIYKGPYMTDRWKTVFSETALLSGSYLLYNTVLYLDRIILKAVLDSEAVSVYYVSSLLGKTAALLVVPLSGVILGHLTRNEERINRKQFVRSIGITIAFAAAAFLVMVIAAPIFIRMFYSDIALEAVPVAPLCNLAQILNFSAFLLLTIMLTVCDGKWQLYIETMYGILYAAVGWFATKFYGLSGFIIGSLVANAVFLILVISIGVCKTKVPGGEMQR